MVFNGPIVFLALLIILWLVVLTILVYRTISHYNQLTRGITKSNLQDVLDTLLGRVKVLSEQEREVEEGVRQLETKGKFHLQRIGIVRYNPFSDTGGAQSFTIALLDGQDNGIVMTSLYARTGNRWYVKEIKSAKGKELELSKEEESAIKKARPVE